MEREKFIKYKFQAYQLIEYKHQNMEGPIECVLIEVNFDNETMILRQIPNIDGEYIFDREEFTAPIKMCEIARSGLLKVVKR